MKIKPEDMPNEHTSCVWIFFADAPGSSTKIIKQPKPSDNTWLQKHRPTLLEAWHGLYISCLRFPNVFVSYKTNPGVIQ